MTWLSPCSRPAPEGSGHLKLHQRAGPAALDDEVLEMIMTATAAGARPSRVPDRLDALGAAIDGGDHLVVGDGVADAREHGLASPLRPRGDAIGPPLGQFG